MGSRGGGFSALVFSMSAAPLPEGVKPLHTYSDGTVLASDGNRYQPNPRRPGMYNNMGADSTAATLVQGVQAREKQKSLIERLQQDFAAARGAEAEQYQQQQLATQQAANERRLALEQAAEQRRQKQAESGRISGQTRLADRARQRTAFGTANTLIDKILES